jgi:chaperonin GroES
MNLQPLADRVIVEALEVEEMTASGLVIPESAQEKPQRGRVLAAGPGAYDENGGRIPLDVQAGDEIVFSKYGGTAVRFGTDEYLILKEADILAKVIEA